MRESFDLEMLQLAGHHFFQSSAKVWGNQGGERQQLRCNSGRSRDDQVSEFPPDLIPRRLDFGPTLAITSTVNWTHNGTAWTLKFCGILNGALYSYYPTNYSPNTPSNSQSDICLWIFVSKCCTFPENAKYTCGHKLFLTQERYERGERVEIE